MSELIRFKEIVERLPVDGVYVLYEVGVSAEWAHGGGDGIHEPAYPGEWLVSATVLSVAVERLGEVKQYERGDSMEEDYIVKPGADLELTQVEREAFGAMADGLASRAC